MAYMRPSNLHASSDGMHLAQEDARSGHQGCVDDIFRCQAIVICMERRSAGVQLRQGRVLVQGLVPVVLRHAPGQVVGKANQQRPPQCVCTSLACRNTPSQLQAMNIYRQMGQLRPGRILVEEGSLYTR